MCGCGAIRLRGPSYESPSKGHLHVAHVFLLLSASTTALAFTTAQPTTAHLNIHNSTHGSEADRGTRGMLVRCDEPLTGRGVVLGPMRELGVGGATRAVAASGALGSLCARDGAILAVCMRVYDVSGFVRVTSIEILAQPREDHRDRCQTGGRQ